MKKTRLNIYDDFASSQIDTAINEWIHNERDRKILHYKLIDGYTYERIAEIFDMSPRRIEKIVYGAEDRLFRHLEIVINKDIENPG